MTTKKIKIITKDKENFNEMLKAYGKKPKKKTLNKLFLTQGGNINKRNTGEIITFLQILGQNINKISDDGDIVWKNKKKGNSPDGQKIQADLKEIISKNVEVKLSKKGEEKKLINVIRGFMGVEGKALIEVMEEEETKEKAEKAERLKQKGEQTNKAKAKIVQEAKAKKKAEQTQKTTEKLALAQAVVAEVKQETEEVRQELEKASNTLEVIKIGEKLIEDGAEEAEADVSSRDKKQDKADVENVELAQVPNEQPITQAPLDEKLQEEQLDENVNKGAEVIINVLIEDQNEVADSQLAQPEQVEPLQDVVVDDVAQIVVNEERKEAERSGQPVITNESLSQGVELQRLKEQQDLSNLNLLNDLLQKLKQIAKQDDYPTDILDEITTLRQKVKDVKARKSPKNDTQRNIKAVLKEIDRKLSDGGLRLQLVQTREAEIMTQEIVEEKKELDERLMKTRKAIREIKQRVINDGLSIDVELPYIANPNSQLIADAIEEMGEDAFENGEVSQNLADKIRDIFNIVREDTREIFVDVLTNTPTNPDDFFYSFMNLRDRISSRLFVRFLSRILYAGTDLTQTEAISNIQAFTESGVPLVGQNRGVVNRLLDTLRVFVPRPPPRLSRTEIQRLQGLSTVTTPQTQQPPVAQPRPPVAQARGGLVEQSVFTQSLNDFISSIDKELNDDIETEEKQEKGTFEGFFEIMTSKTAEVVKKTGSTVEMKEMTDEQFEQQLEEMEDLEANLGTVAQSLATASVASSQTIKESLVKMNVKAMMEKLPNLNVSPEAIRNSFRNRPTQIPRIIKGVARNNIPTFRNIPGARSMRTSRLVNIIATILMGGLLGSISSRIFNKEAEPKETEPQGTQGTQEIQEIQELEKPTGGERGTTTEFFKGQPQPVPAEDIDKPTGEGLLRADFLMSGIDFFNKQFATTPLDVQNSEWAEFDYVNNVDRQNNIEKDNSFGQSVRFQEPLFMPKFQPKLKPPSQLAVNMGRDRMTPQIQLSQGFAPKFSGAVSVYDNLSYTVNQDAFARSWQDNILYHPDNSSF